MPKLSKKRLSTLPITHTKKENKENTQTNPNMQIKGQVLSQYAQTVGQLDKNKKSTTHPDGGEQNPYPNEGWRLQVGEVVVRDK